MDDQGRQNLPNLKICVDNTEEGEISDSDESLEPEIAIEVDEEKKDGKEKRTDVEFNVRISDLGSENKTKSKTEIYTKKYENRDGDFITGIDLTSKEALEKKEERARRFGIEVQDKQDLEIDVKGLYTSLGVKEEDFNRGERGIRAEAIHIRGTDNMSTQDVFRYFREFAPGGIEWIDDASCNAVWADPLTAARAMLRLSDSYESIMAGSNKEKTADKKNTGPDNKTKADGKGEKESTKAEKDDEEGEMEVDEYDDDLDLVGDDKKEKKMEEGKDVKMKEEKKSDSDSDKSDSDDDSSHRKEKRSEGSESRKEEGQTESKDGSGDRQKKRGRGRIPWPPGKWRLGHSSTKASCVFLRFATKADKKLPRAESRSKYYVKYGNPNYGGMRGLISTSRKQRYRVKTYEEELAETKAAIESQREAREARERGDNYPEEKDYLPKVSPLKRKRDGSGSEGEELDMEAELQELLGPPVRKQRSMRMYADDEEEMRKSKRGQGSGSSGVMTVVAGGRMKQPVGRVKDARELIQRGALRSQLRMDRDRDSSPESVPVSQRIDLRMRIRTSPSVSGSEEESEDEQEESSSEDSDRDGGPRPSVMSRLGPAGRASGDSDSDSRDSDGKYRAKLKAHKSVGRVGSDLRSRLGGRKGPSDNSKYPSMRIEVFE